MEKEKKVNQALSLMEEGELKCGKAKAKQIGWA
jgi:hypothetical protein